jgi:hypothetical protein
VAYHDRQPLTSPFATGGSSLIPLTTTIIYNLIPFAFETRLKPASDIHRPAATTLFLDCMGRVDWKVHEYLGDLLLFKSV